MPYDARTGSKEAGVPVCVYINQCIFPLQKGFETAKRYTVWEKDKIKNKHGQDKQL